MFNPERELHEPEQKKPEEKENFDNIEESEQFIDKKRKYFQRLSLEMREALKLHKKAGLWERKENKREWGRVTKHCLVEAVRVDILADKLGLSEDIKKDLKVAAVLHDFFKKNEIEIASTEGSSWESFTKASEQSKDQIKEAGFSERIIYFTGATGHESLIEAENILNKESFSSEDIAFLIMHYVDVYTIENNWVSPVEKSFDGKEINDLDRRVDKSENFKLYDKLNKDGKKYLKGETLFATHRRIGHLVEKKLATIYTEKSGENVNSKELPQIIDEEIKREITKL